MANGEVAVEPGEGDEAIPTLRPVDPSTLLAAACLPACLLLLVVGV